MTFYVVFALAMVAAAGIGVFLGEWMYRREGKRMAGIVGRLWLGEE